MSQRERVNTEAFERCWHDNARRVTAYAERHVGVDAAYDVLSNTFLTAWRTWSVVPDPPLPWLISAARGHVRNHLRSIRRQHTLAEKMALLEQSAYAGTDTASTATDRADAIAALAALPDSDREALLLVSWEGLTYAEAAEVLQCRTATLRVRVHRARKRLGLVIDPTPPVVLPNMRSIP